MSPEDWADTIERQAVPDAAAGALLRAAVNVLLVIQKRSFEEGSICFCCWEHSCSEGCPAREFLEATCDLSDGAQEDLGFELLDFEGEDDEDDDEEYYEGDEQ